LAGAAVLADALRLVGGWALTLLGVFGLAVVIGGLSFWVALGLSRLLPTDRGRSDEVPPTRQPK
jgi:hypothetical protein